MRRILVLDIKVDQNKQHESLHSIQTGLRRYLENRNYDVKFMGNYPKYSDVREAVKDKE